MTAKLLKIEAAYDGDTFVGYRMTTPAGGMPVLLFANQRDQPGFRAAEEFVAIGRTIHYVEVHLAVGDDDMPSWPPGFKDIAASLEKATAMVREGLASGAQCKPVKPANANDILALDRGAARLAQRVARLETDVASHARMLGVSK